ncbi:myb-like protein X isoform X2 [Coccinella septempunctata]|uniref:myb-like protein X isoform X2 n=1 Tax=Coccinella septempunctata TaxID=41139 RepID=UPI001D099365|nr:myb-like protein X isoform X2 [Coccinella septempunctata]
MELHTGVCGICRSKSLVLNSEDSEKYQNLIWSHFQNEFIIPNSKPNLSFCTTCIYHITLINSKKDYFLHRTDNEEIETSGKCELCKETIEVFSTTDSAVLNKCKPWISEEKRVLLCASCFFLIEIRHILKDFCLLKLSQKDDQENHTPKQRGPISRRKSFHEARINSQVESVASTSYERKTEEPTSSNPIESSTIYGVHSTPIQGKKRRRSKNLEELLDEESKNLKEDIQKNAVYTKNELTGYNLSNILNFSPLCNSNIRIKDEYKKDKKMYNFIPFVKMNNLENKSTEMDQCNYVCSLVSQRPMIRVRRTPPIKIKSIKNIFSSKEKKNTAVSKDKQKSISSSKEELSKYKLVVMVERMKLPAVESPEDVVTCKAEGENIISKEAATPKKKKRVHFNDTPTIIITDDVCSDDFEQRNKFDESKNKNIRSIMVAEQRKVDDVEKSDENTKNIDEQSDSEELISLSLDYGSDDESNKDNENYCSNNVEEEEIVENKGENSLENGEEDTSENLELNCVEQGNNENLLEYNEEINNEDNGDNKNEEEDTEDPENAEKNHEDTDKADNSSNQKEEESSEDEREKNSSSETIVVEADSSEKIPDSQGTEDEYFNDVLTQIDQLEDALIDDNTSKNESVEKLDCDESTEEGKDNLENEKDSLDGFEVVDEENEEIGLRGFGGNDSNDLSNHVEESPEKSIDEKMEEIHDDGKEELNENKNDNISLDSGEKIEAKDSFDEIDLLLNKYCGENSEEVLTETDQVASVTNENEKETETLDGEQVIPEGCGGIEHLKSSANSGPISETSDEDFGSLIDEVQKCLLTSTKESLDKTEDIENQKGTKPNTPNLLDILNSSFDETTSSPKENINSNKNLKRKSSDDEIEKPDHKRGKMENS